MPWHLNAIVAYIRVVFVISFIFVTYIGILIIAVMTRQCLEEPLVSHLFVKLMG